MYKTATVKYSVRTAEHSNKLVDNVMAIQDEVKKIKQDFLTGRLNYWVKLQS